MKDYWLKILIFTVVVCFYQPLAINAQKKKPPVKKPPVQKPSVEQQKTTKVANQPIPPAQQEVILSAVEDAVLKEINEARNNPQKYVGYLEEYRKLLKGNVLHLPNSTPLVMIEGAAAVDDAINDLKKLPKFDDLKNSRGLNRVAKSQLEDLIENPKLGHKGKDGSLLDQRLLRYGQVGLVYAENISYKVSVAREVVLAMIVDDGLKSRSHRKNIFSPSFKLFGIACGTAKNSTAICVAEFADDFSEMNLK
jgi:hypothetical protein